MEVATARNLAAELSIDNKNAEAPKETNGEMYKSSGRLESSVLNYNGERCGCCDDDDRGEDCDSRCNGDDDSSEKCERCEDDSDDCDDDQYSGYAKKGKNSEFLGHNEKGKSAHEGGYRGGEKGEYPGPGRRD